MVGATRQAVNRALQSLAARGYRTRRADDRAARPPGVAPPCGLLNWCIRAGRDTSSGWGPRALPCFPHRRGEHGHDAECRTDRARQLHDCAHLRTGEQSRGSRYRTGRPATPGRRWFAPTPSRSAHRGSGPRAAAGAAVADEPARGRLPSPPLAVHTVPFLRLTCTGHRPTRRTPCSPPRIPRGARARRLVRRGRLLTALTAPAAAAPAAGGATQLRLVPGPGPPPLRSRRPPRTPGAHHPHRAHPRSGRLLEDSGFRAQSCLSPVPRISLDLNQWAGSNVADRGSSRRPQCQLALHRSLGHSDGSYRPSCSMIGRRQEIAHGARGQPRPAARSRSTSPSACHPSLEVVGENARADPARACACASPRGSRTRAASSSSTRERRGAMAALARRLPRRVPGGVRRGDPAALRTRRRRRRTACSTSSSTTRCAAGRRCGPRWHRHVPRARRRTSRPSCPPRRRSSSTTTPSSSTTTSRTSRCCAAAGPTLHVDHGIPIAINVGDAMLSLSLQPLLDNVERVGLGPALRILRAVAHMTRRTVEGQAVELDWVRHNRWRARRRRLPRAWSSRRPAGTPSSPRCRSAPSPRAPRPRSSRRWSRSAAHLGAAFQITDDLLNLRADPEDYGKEIGGDLWEGKRTLMLLHALRTAAAARPRPRVADPLPAPARPRDAERPTFATCSTTWSTAATSRPAGRAELERAAAVRRDRRRRHSTTSAGSSSCCTGTGSLDHARAVAAPRRPTPRPHGSPSSTGCRRSRHRDVLAGLVDYVHERTR